MLHCFTRRYGRKTNILFSDVGVSYPFSSEKHLDNMNSENVKKYSAIWDTGATKTAITSKVVNDLNLKPIGKAFVNHADGRSEQFVCLISLFLPNNAIVPSVSVTEAKLLGNEDLLIGMDIIGMGDFAITNHNNKTTFSFRIPSLKEIDFVEDSKPAQNQPCPCGSGKKYKLCHGKK